MFTECNFLQKNKYFIRISFFVRNQKNVHFLLNKTKLPCSVNISRTFTNLSILESFTGEAEQTSFYKQNTKDS